GPVARQVPGRGQEQAVSRDRDSVRDAGYAIGEVGQQPTEILGSRHESCSLPPCEFCCPAVVCSGVFGSPDRVLRPRCPPRWYADSSPRTASGERRCAAMVPFSTPPGTSWVIGTRFGSPVDVVANSWSEASADAARQPSSAAVCQPLPPAATGSADASTGSASGSRTAASSAGAPVARSYGTPTSPDGSTAGYGSGSDPRVRNQADSSSRKIGSSMVSSAKRRVDSPFTPPVAASAGSQPSVTFGISAVMSSEAASGSGTAGESACGAGNGSGTGGQAGGAD